MGRFDQKLNIKIFILYRKRTFFKLKYGIFDSKLSIFVLKTTLSDTNKKIQWKWSLKHIVLDVVTLSLNGAF